LYGCSIVGAGTEAHVNIDGEFCGLIAGHAYSLLDSAKITPKPDEDGGKTEDVRLVKIRNPWGSINPVEWNGKWSDGTTELLDNEEQINAVFRKNAEEKLATKIREEGGKGDHLKMEFEHYNTTADGSFLQDFKDFGKLWHNLFEAVDFPAFWGARRFASEWSEEKGNAGGTPTRGTAEQLEAWCTNTQYYCEIKKADNAKTNVFISLGQVDGRLYFNADNPFPFKEAIRPIIVVIFRLEDGETKLDSFNQKRILKMSPIKQYRDIQLELELPNGKYVIVPETQTAGQENPYWLSIYYDCKDSEIVLKEAGTDNEGEPIAEETENIEVKQDPEWLKALNYLAKENCKAWADDFGHEGS